MKKLEKTEKVLENLRLEFKEEDYLEYLKGNISLKDIYCKFNCSENELRYLFKERKYLSRQAYRESKINKYIFDNINSSDSAYILGFYIADGCISNNKFIISLQEQDKEILDKIRDVMSPITNLNYCKKRINNYGITTHAMYKFSFACKYITDKLECLGFGKDKTNKAKSIKNIIPKKFMWDFIRGYWDGDGCISSSETTKKYKTQSGDIKEYKHTNIGFTIISKDKLILDELNSFFHEENINTHVYPDSKGNYLIGTHSLSEIVKIYEKIYTNSNLYLNRKYEKFKQIMETPR
jgi:intein/homing endonuclease